MQDFENFIFRQSETKMGTAVSIPVAYATALYLDFNWFQVILLVLATAVCCYCIYQLAFALIRKFPKLRGGNFPLMMISFLLKLTLAGVMWEIAELYEGSGFVYIALVLVTIMEVIAAPVTLAANFILYKRTVH